VRATAVNFLKFLQGTKQFVIPIYQRTYSWKIDNCQQLWDDILRIAQDDQIPAHFLGSVVYVERGIYHVSSITQLLLIDGQQRLTTLSLLLAALGERLATVEAEQRSDITRKKIYNYYLLNAEESGDDRYKLLLTRNDKTTLISILEGTEEPDPASIRIQENYRFFQNLIQQDIVDPMTLYKGISKLVVVDISLEPQDNPQLIFESLNSTGMDLSQADLIRNYVLMGLEPNVQEKLYTSYWYPMEQSFGREQNVSLFNRFMRDYLTTKADSGKIPNIDEVYVTFKAYHQRHSTLSISEIVEDIYRYSKYFIRMVLAREKDAGIKQCFDDIKTLDVNVVYPFLLEVCHDYELQRLSRSDFIAILRLIESYVFRRLVCGIPTNNLNKVFAALAREVDKEHYLESVQANLLQKSAGARFPRDEEFRTAFVVKNMYNFRVLRYLLSKMENYKRKESVNIDEYTIEHILPQNARLSPAWQEELGPNWQEVQEKYLHTIGNLTLTGYNAELSDSPFLEKRDMEGGFAGSPLQLNKGLASVEQWNAAEIEKRAQKLASIAIDIWTFPSLTAEQISGYSKRPQREPLVEPLAEVMGPIEYPPAGFIPEGFKIIRVKEKRFYYYRLIEDEWIQYGNGKRPWYATSWEMIGKTLREFARKDVKPLGVEGEVHLSLVHSAGTDNDRDQGKVNGYTLDSYPSLQGGPIRDLFEHLRKRILHLDPSVREEYRKLYIAYKAVTNFVDIEPLKGSLLLSINIPFSELDDPKGLARDVTELGHHGNGDVAVTISSLDQLDDVMELIRQSFEKQREEEDV